jgi:hypothetical protein
VLAIVAIGLAVIGILLGLMNLGSIAFAGAIQEVAASAIPAGVRPAYRELLAAQNTYMPVGALLLLFGFGLSIAQLVGGVFVVRGNNSGLLSWVALGNVAFYVLTNVLWAPLQTALIWPAMEAYLEAAKSMPGGEAGAAGAQVGSVGGIAMSVVIGLAMAGFWGWVWTSTRPRAEG